MSTSPTAASGGAESGHIRSLYVASNNKDPEELDFEHVPEISSKYLGFDGYHDDEVDPVSKVIAKCDFRKVNPSNFGDSRELKWFLDAAFKTLNASCKIAIEARVTSLDDHWVEVVTHLFPSKIKTVFERCSAATNSPYASCHLSDPNDKDGNIPRYRLRVTPDPLAVLIPTLSFDFVESFEVLEENSMINYWKTVLKEIDERLTPQTRTYILKKQRKDYEKWTVVSEEAYKDQFPLTVTDGVSSRSHIRVNISSPIDYGLLLSIIFQKTCKDKGVCPPKHFIQPVNACTSTFTIARKEPSWSDWASFAISTIFERV